jgi:hypothetical protein
MDKLKGKGTDTLRLPTMRSIYLHNLTTVGLLELRINDNNNNLLKPTLMVALYTPDSMKF